MIALYITFLLIISSIEYTWQGWICHEIGAVPQFANISIAVQQKLCRDIALHIDGLVQNCNNSVTNVLELPQLALRHRYMFKSSLNH